MDRRPASSEYAAYYERYIARVPDGDIIRRLEKCSMATLTLLAGLTEEQAGHRYEYGKWSVREVLGHLVDCERVFAYRALRIARGDTTPLSGFDENRYSEMSGYDARPVSGILSEFEAVRGSTLALFKGIPLEAWSRTGTANNAVFSVRALAWITAGHEMHHVGILRERYEIG